MPAFPVNLESLDGKSVKLWRYLDYLTFMEIGTRGLFFPRVTKFPDAFEGRLSVDSGETFGIESDHELKPCVLASCWCASEVEQMAFWQMYGKDVAIVSSIDAVNRMATAIGDAYGCVKYVDHHLGNRPPYEGIKDEYLKQFFFKTRHYEFEREFRVLAWDDQLLRCPTERRQDVIEKVDGHWIVWDINELVEEVVISPFSGERERFALSSLCDRLGIKSRLRLSKIQIKK